MKSKSIGVEIPDEFFVREEDKQNETCFFYDKHWRMWSVFVTTSTVILMRICSFKIPVF